MMCPACARGSHTEHQRTTATPYRYATAWPTCNCPGDCTSAVGDALDRLTAAGVIAPPSVRRMD